MTEFEKLSDLELFFWGAAGGLVIYLVQNALPAFADWTRNKPRSRPTWIQVVGAAGTILGNGVLGGVAAILVGEATLIRQALTFGMTWPVILKSAGQGLQAVGKARAEAHPAAP